MGEDSTLHRVSGIAGDKRDYGLRGRHALNYDRENLHIGFANFEGNCNRYVSAKAPKGRPSNGKHMMMIIDRDIESVHEYTVCTQTNKLCISGDQ